MDLKTNAMVQIKDDGDLNKEVTTVMEKSPVIYI